jgi:uncharacterized protein YciI
MKLLPFAVACALTLMIRPALAADEASPKTEMGRMQMILLSRPTNAQPAKADPAVAADQRRAIQSLLQSGKLVFAGTCTDTAALREVLVLKTADTNEARTLVAGLPAVKSGQQLAETIAWYGPVNLFHPPAASGAPEPYVFGLLLRGTNAAQIPREEATKIQEGHMANIRRLAEAKKLVVAGPFIEGGERRGIFLFKVASLAEAQSLADTDPAVIAGRLRIEVHPMDVPAGLLR